MSVVVIPAIDLRGGRVVRLRQGDYGQETAFPDDPARLAQRYADAGARWLHVVDLDGARAGRLAQLAAIERIASRSGLRVQAGGGVRTADDICRLRDAGVARVVLGSVSVTDPDATAGFIERFGADRLVLALDVRHDGTAWRLPVRGWTEDTDARLEERIARHVAAGVRHVLCTDIGRDGTLAGFNVDLYRGLHAIAAGVQFQASGGACSLADVRAAGGSGAAAVVLGRALLEGRITLREAMQC